jgi:hypothetical protein
MDCKPDWDNIFVFKDNVKNQKKNQQMQKIKTIPWILYTLMFKESNLIFSNNYFLTNFIFYVIVKKNLLHTTY